MEGHMTVLWARYVCFRSRGCLDMNAGLESGVLTVCVRYWLWLLVK